MGAGASSQYELTAEQKAEVARAVQEKYTVLKSKSVDGSIPPNEVELFESLKHVYEETISRSLKLPDAPLSEKKPKTEIIPEDKATATTASDAIETAESKTGDNAGSTIEDGIPLVTVTSTSAPPGLCTTSADLEMLEDDMLSPLPAHATLHHHRGSDDDHDHHHIHEETYHFSFGNAVTADQHQGDSTISKIEGPGKLLKAKTSTELLSLVNDSVLGDQEKIASFINQLKAGEVQTKQQSDFRQRRLTYDKETKSDEQLVDSSTALIVSSSAMAPPPKVAPKLPTKLARSRTSIFASAEIGVVHQKKPPFPDNILGTYSCHGIEPAPDEVDGIHEKINQDRGCVVYPYNGSKEEALFMVLDGHGEQGDKVSEFVMRQIVVSLEKDPLLNSDPTAALKNAYITTNTALLVTDINYMTSGTTCVTVYLKENRFYVANCGDSRAIMAYKDANGEYKARAFTRDHKPDDPEEQARIEMWGGFVCPPHEEGLSARVYLDPKFTMIGLAMARSIGDHAVKNVGVIAEPEVKIFDLEPSDQFMIMASDGVWEFISNEEAVQIVQSFIHEGVYEACQELIETAASRWQEVEGDYRDDITAIIVKFPLPNFPSLSGSS